VQNLVGTNNKAPRFNSRANVRHRKGYSRTESVAGTQAGRGATFERRNFFSPLEIICSSSSSSTTQCPKSLAS